MGDLSEVLQPVARARGLPNEHYTDDATYAAERDRLLFASWSGLCFGKDIPEPGDAIPVDFLGMPLLALRDREGRVRVYQNTCRHRGMILVDRPRRLGGVVRCPYHSWCYSLAGDLVTTPHVGGPGMNRHDNIERSELGLIEIRSHVWRDVVFVNVDNQADPFAHVHADLIARWADFEGQPLYFGGAESGFSLDVGCNWKLAVENYCESYHLPWVHPGLNAYSRLEDHYNIEAPDSYSGQGTLVYRPTMTPSGDRFPDFHDLPERWESGAEYVAVYPNVLLGVHRDHAFAIILEPKAKGRTVEHIALHYADPEVAGPQWDGMRATNASMWHDVFAEDIFVVEGMQKGRQGIYFDGGKFSPAMDGPTHCFHHWVASRMSV